MARPTKQRPPVKQEAEEMEAQEMGETSEEETREGTEDGAFMKNNRKRSPKGAKNTKAPMDADCGICKSGKPCSCKAKKDGGCGSYGKKMDRNDALTPQEYLAACDLGIQDRSRPYIRARLDSAARLDLKCGAGSISEGEKCSKGTAQKSDPKPAQRKGLTGKALLGTALAVGGGYLALKNGRAVVTEAREIGGSIKRLMETKAKLRALQAQNKRMGISGEGESSLSRFLDRNAPNKQRNTLERAFRRPSAKRDSAFATGFTPDFDQLAI
jgi:hypothetical protein